MLSVLRQLVPRGCSGPGLHPHPDVPLGRGDGSRGRGPLTIGRSPPAGAPRRRSLTVKTASWPRDPRAPFVGGCLDGRHGGGQDVGAVVVDVVTCPHFGRETDRSSVTGISQ